jgi:zeta-carotene desaturase
VSRRFDVAVVGGGFAGMAAGVALARAGRRVVLLDRRHSLGGRVHSHRDAQTGDMIDNGPHLLMGCYHHTRRLLRALGTEGRVRFQPRLEMIMRDEVGEMPMRAVPLPADLGFAAGLLRMRGVGLGDVRRARRLLAAARMVRTDELDEMSCTHWLDDLGVTATLRRLLLTPICLAALNDAPERSSAGLFARVLRQAFSGRRGDSGLGFITGPHTSLFEQEIGPLLSSGGGERRTGVRVTRVLLRGEVAQGVVLIDGTQVLADHVIIAVPHRHVAPLFEEARRASHPVFRDLASLGASPIINIHLWLDRPVLDRPLIGLLGRRTQWIFALDHLWTNPGSPHRLVGVISGAHEDAEKSNDELVRQMRDDMGALFPEAEHADVFRSVVVKEREATISPAPGLLRRRPGPVSPWPNVWWAGDWTNTGLPSTIEGACQSGHAAAEAILRCAD